MSCESVFRVAWEIKLNTWYDHHWRHPWYAYIGSLMGRHPTKMILTCELWEYVPCGLTNQRWHVYDHYCMHQWRIHIIFIWYDEGWNIFPENATSGRRCCESVFHVAWEIYIGCRRCRLHSVHYYLYEAVNVESCFLENVVSGLVTKVCSRWFGIGWVIMTTHVSSMDFFIEEEAPGYHETYHTHTHTHII